MQTNVKFGITQNEVGGDLFRELCAIHPKAQQNFLLRFTLPLEDSRTQAIFNLLAQHGWQPRNPLAKYREGTYFIDLTRTYDEADYDAAEYLEPDPQAQFDAGRTQDGRMELVGSAKRGGIKRGADFAHASIGVGFAVTDRLKQWIEDAGLRRVQFLPTVIDKPPARPFDGPFWELTTDYILPPLSPRNYLYDERHQPCNGNYDDGCYLRESRDVPGVLYLLPEMHYSAQAMAQTEAFDLARTLEPIHGGRGGLVASQRFRQLLKQHNVKMEWRPVRVDSD